MRGVLRRPIVAALAAIGVGTALGAALFGAGAIIVGGLLTAFVVHRRRGPREGRRIA